MVAVQVPSVCSPFCVDMHSLRGPSMGQNLWSPCSMALLHCRAHLQLQKGAPIHTDTCLLSGPGPLLPCPGNFSEAPGSISARVWAARKCWRWEAPGVTLNP